jgi:hypothetical protein
MRLAATTVLLALLIAAPVGAHPPVELAPEREAALEHGAAEALGERRFACLAPIWQGEDGRRSRQHSQGASRVGAMLLVTARRALPAARRFKRENDAILGVELVNLRYSVASMEHLADVERRALAAYPLAKVSYPAEDLFEQRAGCPPVEIQVDGFPRVLAPGEPPPRPSLTETLSVADALVARYGRTHVLIEG